MMRSNLGPGCNAIESRALDLVDLTGLASLHAAAEGDGGLGDRDRLEAAEEGRIALHRFDEDRRADDIDAQAARQLDRRGARKSFERAVDHAGRGAGDDRLVPPNATAHGAAAARHA